MQAINAGVQKGLGKKVAGFVKEEWDKEVPTMLIKGLRTTFSQVGFCNEFLKSMSTKVIDEANPHNGFLRHCHVSY